MSKQLLTESEATDAVIDELKKIAGKRWMVAVWCIEENREGRNIVRLSHRTTWEFPTGDYEKCVEFLRNSMDEEQAQETPPTPEPLRMADFLKPEADVGEPFLLDPEKCAEFLRKGPASSKGFVESSGGESE